MLGGVDTLRGGTGDDTYIVNSVRAHRGKQRRGFRRRAHFGQLHPSCPTLRSWWWSAICSCGIGNALDNIMLGASGSNVFDGGDGDDWLDGGAGSDALNGGAGDDTFVVDALGDSVTKAVPDGGQDTVRSALDGYVLPSNSQRPCSGPAPRVSAPPATSWPITSTATAAPTIWRAGGDGDDIIDGGAGADTMEGGPGNDTYIVDNVGDTIDEAASVTLLRFNFHNLAGDAFDNPGTALKADVINQVSPWTTQDAGSLLDTGLKGFERRTESRRRHRRDRL